MRILAVDDDPSILELLTLILDSFGHQDVVTAVNGKEALQTLLTSPKAFDCLLLDVQMPHMNGIALCEEVRKLPEYRFTPIIMVTAMVQKQYIDEAFEVGATDYVTKPFDFDDLKLRLSDAYRLAAERKAAIQALEAIEEARNVTMVSPEFDLSDPIFLGGVSGCLGLSEFENYVFQISAMQNPSSTIKAVKVSNAEQIFKYCTSDEFRKTMISAGEAIMSATKDGRKFATYWGNGVFLLVLDGNSKLSDCSLEAKLSTLPAPCAGSTSSTTGITCRIGEGVALRASSKLEAMFLIDKAVELADAPCNPVAKVG